MFLSECLLPFSLLRRSKMFIATQIKMRSAPLGASCHIALLTERDASLWRWAINIWLLRSLTRIIWQPYSNHMAPTDYSYRSAFNGFTRDARRAGR